MEKPMEGGEIEKHNKFLFVKNVSLSCLIEGKLWDKRTSILI